MTNRITIKSFILVLTLVLSSTGFSQEYHQARVWTDRQGRTLKATLISSNESVTIERTADGQRFTIPLAMLCDEDQEFVRGIDANQLFSNQSSDQKGVDAKRPRLDIFPLKNLSTLYQDAPMRDIERIFVGVGITTGIPEPEGDFRIFREVNYLEPIRSAEQKLGLSMGSRTDVLTPGFNPMSFYYYSYNIPLNSPFRPYSTIFLVTDRSERVIAIQLNGGSKAALPHHNSEPDIDQIQIIGHKRKFAASARVFWERNHSKPVPQVVKLRSSFYSSQNKPVYGNELYLPAHIGSLVLENIRNTRSAAANP